MVTAVVRNRSGKLELVVVALVFTLDKLVLETLDFHIIARAHDV